MTESERSQIADAVIELQVEVRHLRTDVVDVKNKLLGLATKEEMKPVCLAYLQQHFVTEDRFRPVRSVVYSAVGLILTAVVTAILALVVTHQ